MYKIDRRGRAGGGGGVQKSFSMNLFILFKENRWGCSWPQAIPPISTPPYDNKGIYLKILYG